VGTLPIDDKGKEEVKRTNEIKTAIPLLEAIDIEGKDVSGDALLTQRELVVCPVYNFTEQPSSFSPWAGWILV